MNESALRDKLNEDESFLHEVVHIGDTPVFDSVSIDGDEVIVTVQYSLSMAEMLAAWASSASSAAEAV